MRNYGNYKYKNHIILFSVILGTLGLTSTTTYSESDLDPAFNNQKQIINDSELNKDYNISSKNETLQDINKDISKNTKVTPKVTPGTLVYEGQETRRNWLVNVYRYYISENIIRDHYELVEYKGNNSNVVIPSRMGSYYASNVSVDTTKLTQLIPNYNNVNSITFEKTDGCKTIPSKIENNRIVSVNNLSFSRWNNLNTFNGEGLDTQNFTSFRNMFNGCSKLTTANVGSFNTSRVTDTAYMFDGCSSLVNVSFTNWDTTNVTSMQQMFFRCSSIQTLDLRNFNTPKLTAMEFMFSDCGAKVIRMDNFNMNSVSNKYGVFNHTQSGKELLVIAKDSQLLNYSYTNRVPLNGPIFYANGGRFSNNETTKKYFEKCAYTPEKISIEEFNKFKGNNIPVNSGFGDHFSGWQKEGNGSDNPSSVLDILENSYKAIWDNLNWNFEENNERILLTQYKGSSNEVIVPTSFNGKKIVLKDINSTIIPNRIQKFSVDKTTTRKLTIQDNNLTSGFEGNVNLREVDFSGVDTSNIVSLERMFKGCSNLQKINLSNCNTNKVTSMAYMFQNCSTLTNVDFTNINTSSLNNIQFMFNECVNLKVIDLSSFHLASGINDKGVFTTSGKTELLVLTNDSHLQSIDYDRRFNRIPLNGPSFDAGSGNFDNNQKTKKYFEKCSYNPSKITLEEFNTFKNNLRPTRTEFATTFVSWNPNQSEPSNVNSVLDLGNIIYKATWEDANWDFTENDSEITLTKYKGSSNEVNIPTFANEKTFKLSAFTENFIPRRVTKIICRPDANGHKAKYLTNNMSSAFSGYSNLIEVDLTGLNTENVRYFGRMFKNCVNLSKVNLSNLNTSSVEWMDYMFYDCFKLRDININNWNVENVISMERMFQNVYLEKLDLSNWHTTRLTNTNRMFNGCNQLSLIKMNNFDMTNVTDSAAMFYRGSRTETLIVTNDNYLLNTHNFSGDNTHPLSKPVLNANGGKFNNQQSTKKYFDRCAVTPQKLQQSQFEQFKNENVPTKENAVFRGWTESGTNKNDEGVLNILDKTYTAIWKNTICNTSIDNKKIESTGLLGMVYLPEQFATNTTTLNANGKQEILINKNNSFNIGVRDMTQSRDSWNMTGQLKWNGSNIPGAYIKIDANDNSIKINQNDNVTPYNAIRDLTSANEEVILGNSEEGHLKITSGSANTVMKANPEKTKDAIYDYNLGEVSLVIPDAGVVQDGTYNANLEWNLSNAPQ